MSSFAAQIPPAGMVDLEDKVIPVCENQSLIESKKSLCFTRGQVDVSAFKEYLQSLPDGIWEDENQTSNAQLKRPAHDAWGIKKIVFVFCDDFLQKVLDLPWSREECWRRHLLPIYEAIGIDESKIVRSLLASMPPGLDIPVHHDTGYWVKHTHRVHVAIETGDMVDFMVGPNDCNMTKMLFDQGRIVELNNQAKHAVRNSMDRYRIHLIFDYVEDHPVNRLTILPNERILQTRRSIDLEREAGTGRRCPSFIILGAQKSGTTSLYEMISQHPLVVKGTRRETHFFDWRWPLETEQRGASPAELHEKYLEYFQKEILYSHASLISGDSTPSYLFHSDLVIPRIKIVIPESKLLIILRNPVDRAYSQYKMCLSMDGDPAQQKIRGMSSYIGKSFETIVSEEIKELTEKGIEPCSSGVDFQKKIASTRPMGHGGHSIIARGLYELQLQPFLEAFPQDQLKIMTIGDLKGCKQSVQQAMESVFSFIGLPTHDLDDMSPKNTRDYDSMSRETRKVLEDFYAPFNASLMKMLQVDSLNW